MLCILAHGLTKSYGGIDAVSNVDLSVKRGQVFGFLGPNGAGKSTTIKLLTTLLRPDSGSLSVLGIDVAKHPLKVRRRIGVVLQQPSYEPTLTVEKALEAYGVMWGTPARERKSRVKQLLADFDLEGIRTKRNEDLSIGQRRRVQVAREFMHDMDLLFLDEPTSGLDPAARRRLLDYLKAKVRSSGLTIFYTTHILTEAEYICDSMAIINGGQIVAVDSPAEFARRFGREKTTKIHISSSEEKIPELLAGIQGCTVKFGTGTDITIRSSETSAVLTRVLRILDENHIMMEDLSAAPTSLEEIFLKVVNDSNASDNQAC